MIIFTRVHRVRWGGGGEWMRYAFKNVDYDALHFHTGSLKINIFKVHFWEAVNNYGRPLSSVNMITKKRIYWKAFNLVRHDIVTGRRHAYKRENKDFDLPSSSGVDSPYPRPL